MKKAILCVLSAIIATATMAQTNPKSGYVITNTGDTLRGTIDFRTNERLSKQCDFYANGETTGKTYKPGDIEGFRFEDGGKYFVSRRLNVTGTPELYFAEFMVQGKMNLYCISYKGDDYFFFEREDGEMAQLTNRNLNYASSNAAEKMQENQQEKQAQYGKVKNLLLKSWKAVEDMDDNNMSRKKLVKTVRDYHNDVCTDGSACMVYAYDEKSDFDVKFHFKALAGYAYYSTDIPEQWEGHKTGFNDYPGSTYEIGVGIEIDFPRIKGLSAEAELCISPKKKSSERNINDNYSEKFEKTIYAISVGAIKQFGKGKIKPLVRGGAFYSIHTSANSIKIYRPKNYISSECEIFDNKYMGFYLGAGVQIPIAKSYARLHGDWHTSFPPGKDKHPGTAKWGVTLEFIL